MDMTIAEAVKVLQKTVKKKYELDPKTELHLIYTVGNSGKKMGAPRVEFHRKKPMAELHYGDNGYGVNGPTNRFNGLEVTAGAEPRSLPPRLTPIRAVSPPKSKPASPIRAESPHKSKPASPIRAESHPKSKPASPIRAESPPKSPQSQRPRSTASFAPKYDDQTPGRRASSTVFTGAVNSVDFSDTHFNPLQGVNATDYQMDNQVALPSIRPMDGPPLNYGEPSYSTRYLPIYNGPPPQDYYQSWVHNARPPSTDRRVYMSFPEAAPRGHVGRAGSTWRHIQQVTGTMGNTLMFIDGTVKSDDVQRFPPWGFTTERQEVYNQPTHHNTMAALPKKVTYPSMHDCSQYHGRAKKGFKNSHGHKRLHSPIQEE